MRSTFIQRSPSLWFARSSAPERARLIHSGRSRPRGPVAGSMPSVLASAQVIRTFGVDRCRRMFFVHIPPPFREMPYPSNFLILGHATVLPTLRYSPVQISWTSDASPPRGIQSKEKERAGRWLRPALLPARRAYSVTHFIQGLLRRLPVLPAWGLPPRPRRNRKAITQSPSVLHPGLLQQSRRRASTTMLCEADSTCRLDL